MRYLNETLAGVIAVLLAIPAAADAQAVGSASGEAQSADETGKSLDIVVTATRREERLQNVPISIQAVSGDDFVKSAYKNPSDLQYLSPSVQVSASGGIGFTLRGVGTNSYDPATEQTVGQVIDGVVYGFVDDISADLSDVARIEVLKGPQGTQFGKNASAGVVNIITERPKTDRVYAVAHASYGSYNDTNVSARVNVPLTGNLAAMLVGSYQNRDGWVYNAFKRNHEGGQDQESVKAKLFWQPSSDFDAYLSVDYRRLKIVPNFLTTYRAIGVGGGFPVAPAGLGITDYGIVPSDTNTVTAISVPSYRRTRTGGGSLEMNYHFGDYTITSVSALRYLSRDQFQHIGGTPINIATGMLDDKGHQISQELRLTSPKGGLVEFVGGLYFYNRNSTGHTIYSGSFGGLAEMLNGPGTELAFSGGRDTARYDVKSYAGFADGTVNVSDKFHVILGGRLTYDKARSSIQTVVLPNVYPLGPTPNGSGSASTDGTNFSWRAGLKYDVFDHTIVYATASRGYKGPLAISVPGAGSRVVKPETVQAYEVGIKSTLLNGRLLLNLAAFDQKFHNFQTSVLDTTIVPPGFILGNAGGIRTRGVEVEMSAKPTNSLTFSIHGTYQDAKFTDFLATCYDPNEPIKLATTTNPAAIGACYTIPGTSTRYTQAAGRPIPNASKWNLTLSGSYEHPVTEHLNAYANVDFLYRSKFFTNGVDPNTQIDGYSIVNVNVGLGQSDNKWKVSVFARNLFNKYYVSGVEPGPFDSGALQNVINPEARRTIGIAFDTRFN